jgi:hypothetical protein
VAHIASKLEASTQPAPGKSAFTIERFPADGFEPFNLVDTWKRNKEAHERNGLVIAVPYMVEVDIQSYCRARAYRLA